MIFGRQYSDRDNYNLKLMTEMANSVDFHKENQKQSISHIDKTGDEYTVNFLREGRGIYYDFNGFGDIFGYYVRASTARYLLDENRIGINGEVALYLSNPNEKYIFVTVDPTSELSNRY